MRVISGTARGRRLKELPGMDTRPTTDKVKESLFNIVQFDIEGRRVLDLFGGSGSTLIACEETDRICRTMELDPKYASVIVQRYAAYKESSDDIKVLRHGKELTFAEVADQVLGGQE